LDQQGGRPLLIIVLGEQIGGGALPLVEPLRPFPNLLIMPELNLVWAGNPFTSPNSFELNVSPRPLLLVVLGEQVGGCPLPLVEPLRAFPHLLRGLNEFRSLFVHSNLKKVNYARS